MGGVVRLKSLKASLSAATALAGMVFAGASAAETIMSVTQMSYDAVGRLECSALRMNSATYSSVLPDACTLATAGTEGPDRITKNVYDAAGQVTQVLQAVSTTDQRAYSTFSYSPNGKVVDSIDANGNRTRLTYDGFDRLSGLYYPSTTAPGAYNPSTQATALASAGAHSTTDYEAYGYDANGNRTWHRRRNTQIVNYQYDNLNREIVKDLPDFAGNPGGSAKDIYTTYDLSGRILSKRFGSASGAGVSYVYDALGRLKSSTDMNSRGLWMGYLHPNAVRTALVYSDGYSVNTDDRDVLGRLKTAYGCWDGSCITLFTQAYDHLGRRTALTGSGGGTTYGYDNLGRLTSMTNDLNGTGQDITWGFSYSPASQLKTINSSNTLYDYRETASSVQNKTFNGLNQDASIAALGGGYDANGNMANDGNRVMTYDVENRLLSVNGTGVSLQLEYDPEGRLSKYTANSTVTTFLYDGVNLIGEYDGSGNLLRRYIHGDGVDEPIVWYEGGDRRYLYKNYQGSVIAYTGALGNLHTAYKYGPYGEPKDINNNPSWSGSRFRYTGQTMLPEAQLYYYKARVYDPNMGRFLQTDPIGSKDDLNLYAYTGGDPINNMDPRGTDCVSSNGTTTCTTDNYSVSFPQQKGFQDFTTQSKDYHAYSVPANSSQSVENTRQYVKDNPTPGFSKPATAEGTRNDATPVIGGISPVQISPVTSFVATNQKSGQEVVVNVTLPGHQLQHGIVVREVTSTSQGTVINNWGEGTAPLQGPGSAVANDINNVWQGQTPPAPTTQTPSPYCTAKIGIGC